ncbi:MAG: hypothetical protein IJI20_03390 [Firmicutes bacterium]|nr:hypothetical protein [Bacillota bacterium]
MSTNKDPHRYDDILYEQRPVSRKHVPMKREDRAAQFAPFAALTGYGEAVSEMAEYNAEWVKESNQNDPFEEGP